MQMVQCTLPFGKPEKIRCPVEGIGTKDVLTFNLTMETGIEITP